MKAKIGYVDSRFAIVVAAVTGGAAASGEDSMFAPPGCGDEALAKRQYVHR